MIQNCRKADLYREFSSYPFHSTYPLHSRPSAQKRQ